VESRAVEPNTSPPGRSNLARCLKWTPPVPLFYL